MKPYLFSLALIGISLTSCDEAQKMATKVKATVKKQMAKSSAVAAEPLPDPELLKLVDQTPDGIIFRKDLPFPIRFEVNTTLNQEVAIRVIESSAISQNRMTNLKGLQTTVNKYERSGDQVRYTMAKSIFTEPVSEGADADKEPVIRQLAPPTRPQIYVKSGSLWKSGDSEGIRAVLLSKQLSPSFDYLLVENALAPRPLWFGKKRFKIGDQLTVSDKTLPMLLAGNAIGSFTLTLESIGNVTGHPCGVFTITGNYKRKQVPDFDGVFADEDISIPSGKIWLSLLYPLVLKQELVTIQTLHRSPEGGPDIRSQGSVKVSLVRDWKKL
jgi:hypothetical protein